MENYFGDMLKDDSPSLEAVVQKGVRIPGKVRKFFAGYFSLGLLLGGLGVGMARGQEKEKPVNIGQAPDKATTLVYNPNDNSGSSSTLIETPIPAPARNLDFILTSQFFPEPLVQVYQTMPSAQLAKALEQKPAETKKDNTIWWIIGGIAAAVGGYLIYKAVTKETPTPTPVTPTYKETTLTLNVKDVLTKAALANILAEYDDIDANSNKVHETYTTDGSGNVTIKYKEATAPNIMFSGANYNTRSTYLKWLANNEVTLIPSSFDMNTFNIVCRGPPETDGIRRTLKWTQQPTYYIINDDMDDDTRTKIKTYLSTDGQEKGSTGKIKGTTNIQEVALSNMPGSNSHSFIYRFDVFDGGNDTTTWAGTNVEYDHTSFEITRVIVRINIKCRDPPNQPRKYLPDGAIAHESFHGLGHYGHGNKAMLMGNTGYWVPYITQFDIDNGTLLYNRPSGNIAPDNDPSTGGANNVSSLNAANMMMPMQATFTTPSITGSSRIASMLRMLNLPTGFQTRNGNIFAGADISGGAVLGYDDGKSNVSTTLRNIGVGPLESITTASYKNGFLTAGAQMLHSGFQHLYQVGGSAQIIPGTNIMVFDAYDAIREINTINVGTSLFNNTLMFSYGSQTGRGNAAQVFNGTANLGKVIVSGSVAKYSPQDIETALNVSAKLGTAVFYGSFDKFNEFMKGSVSMGIPITPNISFNLSKVWMPGVNDYRVAITGQIPIKH